MSIFWKKFWRGFAASAAIALMLPVSVPGIAAFITGGSGGGGTPGGSDTQVQYNDAGAFGGDAGLVFNETTNALTGTGLWTVTQGSANTGVLASTGYSLTGSDATSMIDLAGTWNTSGTPTAIKLNVTNTASSGNSRLIDLQTGGTSRVNVSTNGTLSVTGKIMFGLGGAAADVQFLSADSGKSIRVLDSGGAGNAFRMTEMTAPTGNANEAKLYVVDNGSGKTQLMVIFGSGAAQQLAIEP